MNSVRPFILRLHPRSYRNLRDAQSAEVSLCRPTRYVPPIPILLLYFYETSLHLLGSDVYSPGASNIQDPIYDLPFDNSFTFGSEGANLEYSMINALLNSATSLPENHSSRPSLDRISTPVRTGALSPFPNANWATQQRQAALQESGQYTQQGLNQSPQDQYLFRDGGHAQNQQYGFQNNAGPSAQPHSTSFLRTSSSHSQTYGNAEPTPPLTNDISPESPLSRNQFQTAAPSRSLSSNLSSSHSGLPNNSFPLSSMNGSGSGIDQQVMNGAPPDAAAAYASVSRPYDYTAGYHYLMQHLQNRMNGFVADILALTQQRANFPTGSTRTTSYG